TLELQTLTSRPVGSWGGYNNDVVNVINSLNELVLHGHLRQLGRCGRYDHIYSITEKERKYWNELNNKF
ncbi:hypothetical protein AB6C40_23020, partial [Vibrio splendidus]